MNESASLGMCDMWTTFYQQGHDSALDQWMSFMAPEDSDREEKVMDYYEMRQIAKQATESVLTERGENYRNSDLEIAVEERMPKSYSGTDLDRALLQAKHYAERAIIVVSIPD